MLVGNDVALNSAAPSDILTALPGSPIDGQVIYYNADPTNGVVWQLRYRSASASAYKWEFIGGQVLSSTILTRESVPTTNSFTDLTTVGPSITSPLAGDYVITWTATGENSVTANNVAGVGISVGGTDPASYAIGVALLDIGDVLLTRPYQKFHRIEVKTGISASSVIKHRYRQNQANNQFFFSNRFLSIQPIRVG